MCLLAKTETTGAGVEKMSISANPYNSFKSKKCGKDQDSIQLSTPPDPGYHMGT